MCVRTYMEETIDRTEAAIPQRTRNTPLPPSRPAPETESKPSHDPLTPTVFHQEWWLDAATDGRYSIAEVSSGGKTVGRLPYLLRRRYGMSGIWTPPLTYFLGPGIDEGEGAPSNRFLKRMEITRDLLAQLPRSAWQCIRCHGGVTDAIAFQEQRFRTYVQFTHEIPPASAQNLWAQMRDKTRNVIRRAEEQLCVNELDEAEEFLRLYEKNLLAEGEHNTLDLAAARRVLTAALSRGQGRIIAARNHRDEIAAANFCAWDDHTSFYIACTRSEAAGNGGASLLIWEAIQHAAANGRTFDFAGLGARGSILLYSGFGPTVSPRYIAVRATGFARLVADTRAIFGEERYFF